MRLRRQIKLAREDISKTQEVTKTQYEALHNSLDSAVQSSSLLTGVHLDNIKISSNTGFSMLRDAAQDIKAETTTVRRQIDGAQQIALSGREDLRIEIMRTRNNTLKGLRTIQRSTRETLRHQQREARRQQSANYITQRGLAELHSMITSLHVKSDNADCGSDVVINNVDLKSITMPLMLMKPPLFNALATLAEGTQTDIFKEDADLFCSEFNELLAASHNASATATSYTKSSISSKGFNDPSHAQKMVGEKQQIMSTTSKGKKRWHEDEELLPVKARRGLWAESTYAGRLYVEVRGGHVTNRRTSLNAFSVCFTPRPELATVGILATFKKIITAAWNPKISWYLRTFNILLWHNPVFDALKNDDVKKLQAMFSAKEVSPWDRDSKDNTLIWV